VISQKNSFSDDEVQRKCRKNTKTHRKQSFSHQSDLRGVHYDTPEDDFDFNIKQRSRPSSPIKSRSSLNHSPTYGSPEYHSDDLTEEENLLSSYNTAARGRSSRADLDFSDSHGEDSQIPQEHGQNGSSHLRGAQNYEHKQTEQFDEATYSKSASRENFGLGGKTHFPPFLKSETWPSTSAKGTDYYNRSVSLSYENGRMEGLTKKFEDISLRSASSSREPIESNFEGPGCSSQPCFNQFRSTQSSPQLRRRTLHDFKTIHDSMTGLDLASQREYIHDGNLRYNVRSPQRHLIQTRSSEAHVA